MMKLDKNKTLFCDKINLNGKLEVNDILEQIFQKMGAFNYHCGYIPESILLNPNDYIKIKKEKDNVISNKEDGEYILTMKIILNDNLVRARKMSFKDKAWIKKLFPQNRRKNNEV